MFGFKQEADLSQSSHPKMNEFRERVSVRLRFAVAADVSPLHLKIIPQNNEPIHIGCYDWNEEHPVRFRRSGFRQIAAI